MRKWNWVFLCVLAGCQTGPQFTAFKPGTVHADRQAAFDQCKIVSLREIPQNMSTSVSPGYYSPGTISCSSYGTTTTCNRVGEVNIPATSSTYDNNQGLRDRFLMRCMEAKGYSMVPGLRVCKSGAEKNAAIYEPQPASVDQLQCSSGIPLDR
jgi:hypothetical protein